MLNNAWRSLSLILFAALLAAACGCGTIMAGVGEGAVENYGGVKFDRDTYESIRAGLQEEDRSVLSVLFIPLVFLDMPFSFVADTLFLPYTMPRARRHAEQGAEKGKKP
ncbi:MAG: YceK/YidQ family lipoprotein [Kiritimatiellae bacterium]|nr:YceK/YidQ family lipoprotein [Kiritimatiellia bacterium]